jgi:hypothetical protein
MLYTMKPLGCDPQHIEGMSERLAVKTTSIYAHAKPGDSSALYLKRIR